MKKVNLLLMVLIQILFVTSSFSQELFINEVITKTSKNISVNAKNGNTNTGDYQYERQIIDDYLKQINPNFYTGNIKVIVGLAKKEHYRFEVFYKGILVDKHKITLHQLSDTTMLITGTTLFSEDISIEPILSVEQAINKLKESNSNVTNESILSNKLVIYKALDSNPDLCYKIEVLLSELEHYYYYVSAKNGEIIKTSTLVYNYTPAIGTANLHNWGTQTIFTSYDNSINKYILFDQVANIQTYDIDAAISIKYANNLTDLNNNWTIEEFPETETYSMNAALVSHWAARKTYDFFYTTFNRNGIDGNNKKTNIYVNYGGELFGGGASWSDSDEVIFIGSGVTSFSKHHFGVLDVIAHEFGHAVTYYSENDLEYSGESGAISEGISDI